MRKYAQISANGKSVRKLEMSGETRNELSGFVPCSPPVVPWLRPRAAKGRRGRTSGPERTREKRVHKRESKGRQDRKQWSSQERKQQGFTRGCVRLAWRQDARGCAARSVCRMLEASLCSAGSILRVPPLSALVYTVYSALCNLYCCIVYSV